MNTQSLLEKYKIKSDPLKDQFFLEDKEVIRKIVGFADISKKDVVLEVGAGIGNLTEEIAKKAGHVIAFEIDTRFRPFLENLPRNVKVHYENAWKYVQLRGKHKQKRKYNKVVSNLPYSFIEPFLHNLTFLEYDKVILLTPIKILKKIATSGIFGSFFKVEIKMHVPKEKFSPIPKTNSVVIDLAKLPDPIENKNLSLFLRQYMYQHEQQLVKNCLMEGIIKYVKLVHSKKVTKNQARKMVVESGITQDLLEIHPNNSEIYTLVGKKLQSFNKI